MRGGKRKGAGRPKNPPKPEPERESKGTKPTSADRECYARILTAINRPEAKEGEKGEAESKEVTRWRELVEAQDLRIRLDTLKYLYDKRDGKAVQPVDFGDKPLGVKIITGAELPPA